MPSTIVANEACLLTDRGWSLAGSGEARITLLGTDRHGHIVAREVGTSILRAPSRRVIIGTDAAFGVFAPETRIILRDGTTKAAEEIVEDSHPSDLWFENVLDCAPKTDERACIDSLLAMLRGSAPFVLDDAPVIRCRSRDVLDWETVSETGCCRFQKVSAEVYCVITASGFPHVKGIQLQKIVRDLSIALWRNSEEECEEFDCSKSGCCLWYASALHALKVGHVLVYDSLQYSLSVKVVGDSTHKPPFRRCRCAFYYSDMHQAIRIAWESKSWKPIVSGFLISGR
jgi:hypothetical protein